MIRIRVIHNVGLEVARNRIVQVQDIFRENFPELAGHAEKIPDFLARPLAHRYRTVLFVSETTLARVMGFALLLHLSEVNSSFLDFIAVRRKAHGGGIGGALYEAVREYSQSVSPGGMYVEVQPDDPLLTPDARALSDAKRRLRLYEQYGARPLLNTEYGKPVGSPPTTAYLLYDGLNRQEPLGRAEAQAAVRLLLQRRFGHVVGKREIERIVGGFTEDPVRRREPRYVRKAVAQPVALGKLEKSFVLVASEKHTIHHVRSRGYLERPVRVGALRAAVAALEAFTEVGVRRFSEQAILDVHDRRFVNFLKVVCTKLSATTPVYPDTFPIRRSDRRPRDLPVQAGYYCIDSCTPLDKNAYEAARVAVDVALTAAEEVLSGCRVAYALCRPPGHHAERTVYGGFCYFNNAAIAAHHFSKQGPTAVLDLDYHHGNGTQDIFYRRRDVLTVSLHGHPDYAFPYFSGFANETGEGPGEGFNQNHPLGPGTTEEQYLRVLEKALARIRGFRPSFVVVSLGFDILKGDPTGRFVLPTGALGRIGERLVGLRAPLLIVQEGGYNLRNLRRGAEAFFGGVASAMSGAGTGRVSR